ncbi:LacI family DNA-binding transcriptional regulator [Paenibacillus piri]|uniref:LacI family transcriptional regulator n=1 Tax=Paenibacillus piri TaxID=2547395 RepID=A0A4R5KXM2_9BACL|nr:LacI family DNA-binding transcriptional regulator [Paenibacillus piri]TDG00794.1 LacI family transcriptional regulator [Paenibacillus piri]
MATIRDVSKLAGVSVATVSRVLNKSGYVHKSTIEAVEKAMQTLQYKPSHIARSLAGKRTATVALIVPNILNPFFPLLARAIEDTAQENGFSVLLCNSDSSTEKERQYMEVLATKQVDGLLLASYTARPEELSAFERDSSIPVVLVDNCFPGQPIASFIARHREGARMAVRHLTAQGCRKIAHISGPPHVFAAHERRLAYEELCQDQPWYTPDLIVQSDYMISGGELAVKQLLSRHPDVDGVFAGNDLLAVGAMRVLYAMGVHVPGQIKLIGFDGVAVDYAVPGLSTVVQPVYEIGTQAMRHLLARIRGESVAPEIREFDTRLASAASTGC